VFATDAAKITVATPTQNAVATQLQAAVANPLVAECVASVFWTESSLARSVAAAMTVAKLPAVLSQLVVAALVVLLLQLPKLRLLCLQLRLSILPLLLLHNEALLFAKL